MTESCTMRETETGQAAYRWDTLPPIPDETGFAGSFAGVSNGALLVAGGANFPNGGTPWNGGVKTWYDNVFVLEQRNGRWKEAGKLPRPLGYGVSITTKDGLLCIGGSNAGGHYADVFLLQWKDGRLETTQYPPLPAPLANSCGALAGNRIYVAGGLRAPDSPRAAHDFFMLDLSDTSSASGWQALPVWPGPARMLSVAGASGQSFSSSAARPCTMAPASTFAMHGVIIRTAAGVPARPCLRLRSRPQRLQHWVKTVGCSSSAVIPAQTRHRRLRYVNATQASRIRSTLTIRSRTTGRSVATSPHKSWQTRRRSPTAAFGPR